MISPFNVSFLQQWLGPQHRMQGPASEGPFSVTPFLRQSLFLLTVFFFFFLLRVCVAALGFL